MNFKNLFFALTFTFLFHGVSNAGECIPVLNHGLSFDPIGIIANGTPWYGYVQKINNTAYLYDQSGKYLGAYAASTYSYSGDCIDNYTTVFKVDVPGDNGQTFVEINLTSRWGDWFTRVLWAGTVYKRSSIYNYLD